MTWHVFKGNWDENLGTSMPLLIAVLAANLR